MEKQRNQANHPGHLVNWNPTRNCFLTTYHPSLVYHDLGTSKPCGPSLPLLITWTHPSQLMSDLLVFCYLLLVASRGLGSLPPTFALFFSVRLYILFWWCKRGYLVFVCLFFKNLFLFCFATSIKPCKTLFIHTVDLKNVQNKKKKEKGEFIGHQISSN